MYEHHAMDITNATIQDEIANSLIAPIEEVDGGHTEWVPEDEAGEIEGAAFPITGLSEDEEAVGDYLAGDEEQAEPANEREGEAQESTEAIESQPPLSLEESIKAFDAAIAEYELQNDTAVVRESMQGVAAALGIPLDPRLDFAAIDQNDARVALSAAQCVEQVGGDFSKIGPVSREAAVLEGGDIIAGFRGDPRLVPDDAKAALGEWKFWVDASIYEAVRRTGSTDVRHINASPDAAVAYVRRLVEIFGGDPSQVNIEGALRLADAYAARQAPRMHKLAGLYAEARSSAPHQRPAARQRAMGRRAQSSERQGSPFETNQDIFDLEAIAEYRKHHGRL